MENKQTKINGIIQLEIKDLKNREDHWYDLSEYRGIKDFFEKTSLDENNIKIINCRLENNLKHYFETTELDLISSYYDVNDWFDMIKLFKGNDYETVLAVLESGALLEDEDIKEHYVLEKSCTTNEQVGRYYYKLDIEDGKDFEEPTDYAEYGLDAMEYFHSRLTKYGLLIEKCS